MKPLLNALSLLLLFSATSAAGEWSLIASGHWLERAGDERSGADVPGEVRLNFEFDAGAGIGVGLLYQFSERWAAEVKGSFARMGGTVVRTLPDAVFILHLEEVDVVPITAVIQWRPDAGSQWMPYLAAGGGYLDLAEADLTEGPGTIEFDGEVGLVLAAGLDFALSERWFVNVDVKYIPIENGFEGRLASEERGTFEFDPILASAGLRYRF